MWGLVAAAVVSPPDYGGIAAVITAVGVLVAALAAAYVSVLNTRRIKATEVMVKQIDNAVNGKPPGASTMVSQVQDLHNQLPQPVTDLAVLPLLRKVAEDLEAIKQGRKVE